MLIVLVVRTHRSWVPLALKPPVAGALAFWICLGALVTVRVAVDLPVTGLNALRDSLFLLEATALLVGLAAGRLLGRQRTITAIGWLLVAANLWLCLVPFQSWLEARSPIVGLQRPETLVAFNSQSFVPLWGIAFAVFWRHRAAPVLLFAALAANVLSQYRLSYLLLIPVLLGGRFLDRRVGGEHRRERTRPARLRWAAFGLIALLIISSFTPVFRGRFGQVGVESVLVQLGTLAGGQGPGEGSIDDRAGWWRFSISEVGSSPTALVFGTGLGTDLNNGFRTPDGGLVRKPHNDYLEVPARLGLLGAFLWFGGVAQLGVGLYRRRRDRLAGFALIGLLVVLAVSFVQPLLAWSYVAIPLWGLVGSALAHPVPVAEPFAPNARRQRSIAGSS